MAPPTVQTLQRLAAVTGYRLDTLEKVLRLLELLDEIAQDPVLSQRLALKGGTALNVFYLDLDRLSVDIDLNYVGALDLAAMERERPEVDAAIDRLFASHGYGVRRWPTGHAGGKWLARYASALGGNASLELDLNYMARQPLFGAVRMESRILGRVGTGRVLVLDLHEIVAGKIVALFDRGAARDLFDVRRILAIERGSIGAGSRPPSRRPAPATGGTGGAYRRTPSDAIHASFAAISPSACPAICSAMRAMSIRGSHSPWSCAGKGSRSCSSCRRTSGAFSTGSSTVAR